MAKKKTPAPRRAGTATEQRFEGAEDVARWIVSKLAADAAAVRRFVRMIERDLRRSD